MCLGTPNVPSVPERQAAKLPDAGTQTYTKDNARWRKAMLAGMVTGPQGALGAPVTAKATLG